MDSNDGDFLNPGIRRTVMALNQAGHVTCDSGDGETGDHDCDRGTPYVSIMSTPDYLTREAVEVVEFLELNGVKVVAIGDESEGVVRIQASFDPKDGTAVIDISDIHDSMLPDVIRFSRATPQEIQ
jgi:hypothetical protein